MAKKNRYNRDGLPIDGKDWTEDDWRDLFECYEQVIERVVARHSCSYCKGQHPPELWCPEKRDAWEKASKKGTAP